MNKNIVELVFNSISTGNGWDDVKEKALDLLKNTNALAGAAPKVAAAFGGMGNSIGAVFANLMKGGFWGALGSIATIGVQQIFAKFEERAKAAEENQKALQKSIEDRYAVIVTNAEKALNRLDDENAKLKEQVDLRNRMLKATLELRRAEALQSGDTATATGIAELLAQHDGQASVDNAEANVYAAQSRVNTAKTSLDAVREARKKAAEELEKAEQALREASKPVLTINQATPGAYAYMSKSDTKPQQEAVKQARLQLELAEKTSKQLNDAYQKELRSLESARDTLKVIQAEQKAAEAKREADREAATKKTDEEVAKAKKKKADEEAEATKKRQKELNEDDEKKKEEERKREEAKAKAHRVKELTGDLHKNKQIADDLQRQIADAWKKADAARKAFADRGNLDQGNELKAKRQEQLNVERMKKVAQRLQDRGIDLENPKRRLSREEEAARRWMIQEREKDKIVKELAEVNKTIKKIEAALEAATTL